MKYIITNKDRTVFIKSPGIVTFDIIDACMWSEKLKAERVLRELKDDVKQQYGLTISEEMEEYELEDSKEIPDINRKINEITEYVNSITKRKNYLQGQISICDKEISDIQHAAEFYSLDAYRGYKLYKILHDVTCKRREYKNEYAKLNYILNSSLSSTSMEKLKKDVYGVDNQKYSPRVLQELFS